MTTNKTNSTTTGGWFYNDSTSKAAITFFENGTFFLAQTPIDSNAASLTELPGMEKGSYVLTAKTFSVSVELDTNGSKGLSSLVGITVPYVFTGDSINVAGQVTLSRITSSTNPIVGSWYKTNFGDAHSNVVITFLADGSYFMAEDGDSNADPSGHDGMEKGTYSWDAQSGSFSAKTLVDTTGEWGLSHINYPQSVSITGNQMNFSGLSLTRVGSATTASKLVNAEPTVGNDSITGTDGNDALDGGLGKDTLTGGNGDDTYIVDNKGDKIIEGLNAGLDTLQSTISYTLGNNLENLELLSSANINATGNALDNNLLGNDGNNVLNGMGGADTLIGGKGSDKLTGGKGADVFTFTSPDDSGTTSKTRDTITDFKHSEGDKIDLSALGFSFISSQAFSSTDATGQLRFDAKTHILYGSTDANNQPEFSILLSGVKSLAAEDLVL